jgi:hypothetical protein
VILRDKGIFIINVFDSSWHDTDLAAVLKRDLEITRKSCGQPFSFECYEFCPGIIKMSEIEKKHASCVFIYSDIFLRFSESSLLSCFVVFEINYYSMSTDFEIVLCCLISFSSGRGRSSEGWRGLSRVPNCDQASCGSGGTWLSGFVDDSSLELLWSPLRELIVFIFLIC